MSDVVLRDETDHVKFFDRQERVRTGCSECWRISDTDNI